MYAGGQLLTVLGAFGVAALPPTLLALWFLRASPAAWRVIAWGSLGFAVTGLVAVLMQFAIRDRASTVPEVALDLLGLAQLLGVPLWTAAFVIGICAAIHWFGAQPC